MKPGTGGAPPRGTGNLNVRAREPRPGNPRFPFPRFPIWPGNGLFNGEGTSDSESRLGRERESGNPPSPDSAGIQRESGSRLAANREIGDTLPRRVCQ
jgi:hypothetical protein